MSRPPRHFAACRDLLNDSNQRWKHRRVAYFHSIKRTEQRINAANWITFDRNLPNLRNRWCERNRMDVHQKLTPPNQRLVLAQLCLHFVECFVLCSLVIPQCSALNEVEQDEPLGWRNQERVDWK